MRYTEVRMAKITGEMLEDIDKETVDFMPNYDGSMQEPTVLPSKIPNLLVNGSAGIAVGMATNIPPHNLSEVVDGCVQLIDKPDSSLEEIMTKVKALISRPGLKSWAVTASSKLIRRDAAASRCVPALLSNR